MALHSNGDIGRHVLCLHNSRNTNVTVWIEPWGDNIVLSPDSAIRVEGAGGDLIGFEVEVRDDDIAVYGWSGSTLSVFDAANVKIWETTIPAPQM